jgi:hypothetical protein
MEGELLEKRFGTVAVERGFITIDQLSKAIKAQLTDNLEEGKGHRRLGTILLGQGAITRTQIDEVLSLMNKTPGRADT